MNTHSESTAVKRTNFKMNSKINKTEMNNLMKQNDDLITLIIKLLECVRLLKKIDSLKSPEDGDDIKNQINCLRKELSESEDHVNEWHNKYEIIGNRVSERIKLNDNDYYDFNDNVHEDYCVDNDRLSIDSHTDDSCNESDDKKEENDDDDERRPKTKPFSTVWKYFNFLNEEQPKDDVKVYKCKYCDKIFKFKYPNASKLRDHLVHRCTSVPNAVRLHENTFGESRNNCKVYIWDHFNISGNFEKCECKHCGALYKRRNATKCRRHLLFKCGNIDENVRYELLDKCKDTNNDNHRLKSKTMNHFQCIESDVLNNDQISYKCNYCKTIYCTKNVTKFREHIVKCDDAPDEAKLDVINESDGRTWTQSRVNVWKHYKTLEECGKSILECIYCGHRCKSKNSTKCRAHLMRRCPKVPKDVRNHILIGADRSDKNKKSIIKFVKLKDPETFNPSKIEIDDGEEKSEVWKHFEPFNDDSGQLHHRCVFCGHTYRSRTLTNGRKLRTHILLKCKKVPDDVRSNVEESDDTIGISKDQQMTITKAPRLKLIYQCPWPGCDTEMQKNSQLIKHQLVHTGQTQRLKCDWPGCEHTARDHNALKNHKYLHTGEKPYVCDWPGCEFRSSSSSSFSVHKKRHQNDFKHRCDWPECERIFLTSTQLKRHKNVHFGVKPYSCRYCKKRYSGSTNFRSHMKKHHPCSLET